jgi:hypothetical protein
MLSRQYSVRSAERRRDETPPPPYHRKDATPRSSVYQCNLKEKTDL